jgi:hypothetical protein
MARRFLPLAVAVAALAVSSARPAAAQENDNEAWSGGFDQKAERRSDFVIGLSSGLMLGSAVGYPNEVDKLDEPAFEASSGLVMGPGGAAWIGGALTDWFTFGVGGAWFGGSGGKGESSGGALIFRVETFPLYGLGGPFRDWAWFATFGAGGLTVKTEEGKRGEGGFTSVAGLGSAYELFRVGHFAFAPSAEYLLIRSPSLTAHQSIFGARVVFYGGPG